MPVNLNFFHFAAAFAAASLTPALTANRQLPGDTAANFHQRSTNNSNSKRFSAVSAAPLNEKLCDSAV